MSRAAPAICGAAMLVPVPETKSGVKTSSQLLLAELMFVPGAARSGFFLPPGVGPRLLPLASVLSDRATVALSSTLATEMTLYAIAGSAMLGHGGLFPAAILTGA